MWILYALVSIQGICIVLAYLYGIMALGEIAKRIQILEKRQRKVFEKLKLEDEEAPNGSA